VRQALPSRRWCRELLAVRRAAEDLLARGARLTDPQMLRLSRRIDRLTLDAWIPPAAGAPPSSAGSAG
jgi:hypothetical protein